MNRFVRAFAAACALGAAVASAGASAQAYPARPLRLVVPFSPGGATDIIARAFGARLAEQLGRPVVIDNKAGASGAIGVAEVARATPDGYTILIGEPGGISIAPAVQKSLPYDPVRDLAPIGQAVSVPMVLVAHPSLGAKSLADLVRISKSGPAGVNYGSPGTGSVQHLSTEQLRLASGAALVHVPYKGGAPALNDLLGGQIPLLMLTTPTVASHIKAGKLVPLVLLARARDPAYPTLATAGEAGYPGFEDGIWQGFFAPADTPRAIVERLNAELQRAAQAGELRERFEALGAQIVTGTPEAFARLVREDVARWAKVAAALN